MRALALALMLLATAPPTEGSRRIEVAPGRSLHLACQGEGAPTVLFEAGGSDWSDVWGPVQRAVAQERRACAYDRAGLGASDPGPGPRSPTAIVEDLRVLLAGAGMRDPVILVGHSLGGFDAKLFAALYPAQVAGLVLLDPAEERSWARTRARMTARFGARLAARAELLDQRFIAALAERYRDCAAAAPLAAGSPRYRRCTDPPRPQLGPDVARGRAGVQGSVAYQQAQAAEIAASVYADPGADAVYAGLFRPGLLGRRPLIVLTHAEEPAEGDPIDALGRAQGLALHRETARLSRRGVHRVVANSGHYLQLDRPDAVIAAIREVAAAAR